MSTFLESLERQAEYIRSIGNDIPPGWLPYFWTVSKEDVPEGFIRVEGMVVTAMKTRGAWKGTPNWKKSDKATKRVFFLDFKAWHEGTKERPEEHPQ